MKVNEYFDGKVRSISFQTETLPATVGVMAPGDYEFPTSQKETMTVISGALTVKLRFRAQSIDYVLPGSTGGDARPTEIRDADSGRILRAG